MFNLILASIIAHQSIMIHNICFDVVFCFTIAADTNLPNAIDQHVKYLQLTWLHVFGLGNHCYPLYHRITHLVSESVSKLSLHNFWIITTLFIL